ncbi:MAG: AMP-binding protein [Spirochaetes bacterium]|nr:AMP-binding protein [Spirochaetota bacterium]
MITDYFADLPDYEYPDFKRLFCDTVRTYKDRPAIRMRSERSGGYDVMTFTELSAEVNGLAGYLSSLSLSKGDRIGLYAENSPGWCCVYLAAVIAGFVIVPVDAMLKPEDVVCLIKDSGMKVIFVSKKHEEKVHLIKNACGKVTHVVGLDATGNGFKMIKSYTAVIEGGKTKRNITAVLSPNDTAALIYTSGTTGLSKGVMLSHRNIIANMNASIQSLPIDKNDVFVTVLPLHHTYPTTCSFLSPFVVGGSQTIAESLAGKKLIANIKETKGTVLIGVPLLYDKLMQGMQFRFKELPLVKRSVLKVLIAVSGFFAKYLKLKVGGILLRSLRNQAGLGTLRLLVAGGGPLNPDTAEFFDALGFNIVQGYGTSENSPLVSVNTVKYNNHRSVGLPVKHTKIRIDEPNAEGVGEILVQSPSVMKGYYKKDEETKRVITENGWLRTGDLGRFDRKGFLYITGRIKNLIVTSGGKNVCPEEIEIKFGDSKIIGEILVFGKKESKKSRAEEVVAVCVPNYEMLAEMYEGQELTDDFVRPLVKKEIDTVNRTLPGYKKIRHFLVRREEFEKTSSRKIKRFLYLDDIGMFQASKTASAATEGAATEGAAMEGA